MIQDTLHRAIGTSTLKDSPTEVAAGLTARLLSGDSDSARDYLAYETGQSTNSLDAKITQLKADFDQAAKTAGEKATRAIADAGWSLFVTFIAGLVGAFFGGWMGAKANAARPIARTVVETGERLRVA
jgi:hypothetical protein